MPAFNSTNAMTSSLDPYFSKAESSSESSPHQTTHHSPLAPKRNLPITSSAVSASASRSCSSMSDDISFSDLSTKDDTTIRSRIDSVGLSSLDNKSLALSSHAEDNRTFGSIEDDQAVIGDGDDSDSSVDEDEEEKFIQSYSEESSESSNSSSGRAGGWEHYLAEKNGEEQLKDEELPLNLDIEDNSNNDEAQVGALTKGADSKTVRKTKSLHQHQPIDTFVGNDFEEFSSNAAPSKSRSCRQNRSLSLSNHSSGSTGSGREQRRRRRERNQQSYVEGGGLSATYHSGDKSNGRITKSPSVIEQISSPIGVILHSPNKSGPSARKSFGWSPKNHQTRVQNLKLSNSSHTRKLPLSTSPVSSSPRKSLSPLAARRSLTRDSSPGSIRSASTHGRVEISIRSNTQNASLSKKLEQGHKFSTKGTPSSAVSLDGLPIFDREKIKTARAARKATRDNHYFNSNSTHSHLDHHRFHHSNASTTLEDSKASFWSSADNIAPGEISSGDNISVDEGNDVIEIKKEFDFSDDDFEKNKFGKEKDDALAASGRSNDSWGQMVGVYSPGEINQKSIPSHEDDSDAAAFPAPPFVGIEKDDNGNDRLQSKHSDQETIEQLRSRIQELENRLESQNQRSMTFEMDLNDTTPVPTAREKELTELLKAKDSRIKVLEEQLARANANVNPTDFFAGHDSFFTSTNVPCSSDDDDRPKFVPKRRKAVAPVRRGSTGIMADRKAALLSGKKSGRSRKADSTGGITESVAAKPIRRASAGGLKDQLLAKRELQKPHAKDDRDVNKEQQKASEKYDDRPTLMGQQTTSEKDESDPVMELKKSKVKDEGDLEEGKQTAAEKHHGDLTKEQQKTTAKDDGNSKPEKKKMKRRGSTGALSDKVKPKKKASTKNHTSAEEETGTMDLVDASSTCSKKIKRSSSVNSFTKNKKSEGRSRSKSGRQSRTIEVPMDQYEKRALLRTSSGSSLKAVSRTRSLDAQKNKKKGPKMKSKSVRESRPIQTAKEDDGNTNKKKAKSRSVREGRSIEVPAEEDEENHSRGSSKSRRSGGSKRSTSRSISKQKSDKLKDDDDTALSVESITTSTKSTTPSATTTKKKKGAKDLLKRSSSAKTNDADESEAGSSVSGKRKKKLIGGIKKWSSAIDAVAFSSSKSEKKSA